MVDNEFTPEELQQAFKETQEKSLVVIEFLGFGSAEFTLYRHNVNPAQVLGALAILELQVKNWYIQEENRKMEMERQQQLSVPEPKILRP